MHVYREKNFSPASMALITKAVGVIHKYEKMGIKITLRQLYYQLVAANEIPNKDTEYKRIGGLISDARYAGLIGWDTIEDRGRVPKVPLEFTGIPDLIETYSMAYRLDRWEGQASYVELFVEKDALASVLAPVARKWHIVFSTNKGYASSTALYDAAQRMNAASKRGLSVTVLYFGDHDPSGLDMIRDMSERLNEFNLYHSGEDFEVVPLALSWEQIQRLKPPPNPAKVTDSRAEAYIQQYGRESWELDALEPRYMQSLASNAIETLVDLEKMDAVIEREDKDKALMLNWAKQIEGGF